VDTPVDTPIDSPTVEGSLLEDASVAAATLEAVSEVAE
jgi:hypothetical protein